MLGGSLAICLLSFSVQYAISDGGSIVHFLRPIMVPAFYFCSSPRLYTLGPKLYTTFRSVHSICSVTLLDKYIEEFLATFLFYLL